MHTTSLNEKLLLFIGKDYPLGLAQGKMGITIYFYYLSRLNDDGYYKSMGDRLLEETIDSLSQKSCITLENGLAGIGLGLRHLIREEFIEGNLNEVLEDIDNIIFNKLVFPPYNLNYTNTELLHLLFYIQLRLKDQENSENIYIYQELLIKVLNLCVDNLPPDFFKEHYSFSIYHYNLPIFLYILGKLLSLDFYMNTNYIFYHIFLFYIVIDFFISWHPSFISFLTKS
ncbi:MAG: hypothetical protein LUG96_13790 [Tannerellaceae bacterium]|nr:hypothetical protein [Tannerellaceae bacterium]